MNFGDFDGHPSIFQLFCHVFPFPCLSSALHHACCHCSDSAQILMAPLTTMTFSSKRWNLSSWRWRGGIRWLTCFLIRFLMDALESDLYMCIYMYIYIITYTEKQCIQHIHVYTMIVRIYNMIYVYYYVSYIDSRFTKQNCVGKGKLALMVCRQCWQTYIFRTMAAQHPPAN